MQTTSAVWKSLWASGNAILETRAIINGVEYTQMSAPTISRALTQSGLSIGNAVSATCQFSVFADSKSVPKAAEIQIQMRLRDGSTFSEWLPAGTFFISHRTYDPVSGLLTLECYDALLKANSNPPADVPWTDDRGEVVTTDKGEWIYFSASYPRNMADMAEDIALTLGLKLDPRSSFASGSLYTIDEPSVGTSIHDVLTKIAIANCGNWVVSPDNKLRLVPVVSASSAASATGNVVDVVAVTSGIGTQATGKISGVRYTSGVETAILGDESGIVIDAGDVSYALASAIYNRLNGMTYQAYTLSGAIYDPAVELGDYVRGGANGEIRSVLYSEVATLSELFHAEISAPESGEMADEYPYIGATTKTLVAAKVYADGAATEAEENAKEYADSVTQDLDNSLDQEEVFNRLTNNGQEQGVYLRDGKIYINGTYIQAGEILATLIKGGVLTLGGLNDINGSLKILDADGNEIGSWDNSGINISAGSFSASYGGSSVAINTADFPTYYRIFKVTMPSDPQVVATIDRGEFEIYSGPVLVKQGDVIITPHYISIDFSNVSSANYDGYISIRGTALDTDKNNVTHFYGATAMYGGGWIELCDRDRFSRDNLFFSIHHYSGFYCKPDAQFDGAVSVASDFSVSGTKSRRVTTSEYSDRLLYCYETPSPLFGDVGEGVIGEDGKCYVWLDAIFAGAITTAQYQVFLQKYGRGDCWISERHPAYFVVEGDPGLSFGWELKAKQKDFDQRRLDTAEEPFTVPSQTYGEDAAQYINDLRKERESA